MRLILVLVEFGCLAPVQCLVVTAVFKNLSSVLMQVILLYARSVRTLYQIVVCILSGKIERREFLAQAAKLACNSWPPVFAIMIALGVVIGVQIGPEFVDRGIGSQLGILSALSMTRELAPVIGSLMIATQFGSGIAAELANMKITEQVDALKVFNVDLVAYLIIPRFISAVLFVPVVIWLAAIMGVVSSLMTVWLTEDISIQAFVSNIWTYLVIDDILLCLTKSSAFGAVIVIIASTLGLDTKGGAKEVGRATTLTVIFSFIAIVALDYLLTSIYL